MAMRAKPIKRSAYMKEIKTDIPDPVRLALLEFLGDGLEQSARAEAEIRRLRAPTPAV
jgi:hypothetical protein